MIRQSTEYDDEVDDEQTNRDPRCVNLCYIIVVKTERRKKKEEEKSDRAFLPYGNPTDISMRGIITQNSIHTLNISSSR